MRKNSKIFIFLISSPKSRLLSTNFTPSTQLLSHHGTPSPTRPSKFIVSAFSNFSDFGFYHQGKEINLEEKFGFVRRNFHRSVAVNSLHQFKLADIGEGITEVQILKWNVKIGDHVKQFDSLCEVQSDKATVEITSRYDGIIRKIYWNEGDMAKVGGFLVDIEDEEAGKHEIAEKKSEIKKEEKNDDLVKSDEENLQEKYDKQAKMMAGQKTYSIDPILAPVNNKNQSANRPSSESQISAHNLDQGKVLTTPAVRKIAKENNLDLAYVAKYATGPNGRLLKEDVLNFINHMRSGKLADDKGARHDDLFQSITEDEIIELSGFRKQMFNSMTRSLEIPHFNYMDEYDFTQLSKIRQTPLIGENGEQRRLSFLPYIVKAVSLALNKFPILNSTLTIKGENGPRINIKRHHNIGIAVDTPNGLVVPNVKSCEQLTIAQIAEEVANLATKAKSNKLSEGNIKDHTFVVSNIGSIGGTYMSPVILAPSVCILAVGRSQKKLVIKSAENREGAQKSYSTEQYDLSKMILETEVVNFSYAADHRVVDGATVAKFSNMVKSLLENPVAMLAQMR